jgi:hypothetical protein
MKKMDILLYILMAEKYFLLKQFQFVIFILSLEETFFWY